MKEASTLSLNIQTDTGLLAISSDVTKSKVISALGYSPAEESVVESHINNTSAHITEAERQKWNNNSGGSGFSGNYNDLTNKPNINDDCSSRYVVQDNNGNAIFKIDANGVHTTNVIAQSMNIGNVDIETETWTFTLEDGSTVTKVVCVG